MESTEQIVDVPTIFLEFSYNFRLPMWGAEKGERTRYCIVHRACTPVKHRWNEADGSSPATADHKAGRK